MRAFSAATLGSLLFFAGFAAMLLASVLFLTGIWHEPILTAGLMISPGPAMAALTAIPGARLGSRFGPGRVGALGTVLFALGGVWWIGQLGAEPDYASAVPAGHADRRDRRGLGDPLADGRRRRDAAAGAVGDRHRGADDRPPARLGAGLRDPDRRARHAAQRRGLPRRVGFMLAASLLAGVSLAAVGRAPARAGVETAAETNPAAAPVRGSPSPTGTLPAG